MPPNVRSCERHIRHTKNKSPSACRNNAKMAEKRCGASESNTPRGESRSETYKSARRSDERCVRFWPQNLSKNAMSCGQQLQGERVASRAKTYREWITEQAEAGDIAATRQLRGFLYHEKRSRRERTTRLGRRRPPSGVLATRDPILCSTLLLT